MFVMGIYYVQVLFHVTWFTSSAAHAPNIIFPLYHPFMLQFLTLADLISNLLLLFNPFVRDAPDVVKEHVLGGFGGGPFM